MRYLYLLFVFNLFFLLPNKNLIAQKTSILSIKTPRIYLEYNFFEAKQQQDCYFITPENSVRVEYKTGSIQTKLKELKKMYTFKSYFKVSPDLKDMDLSLFFGVSYYPCVVYLNKQLIGRVGSFKESYTSQLHFCHNFLLPRSLLKINKDSVNELSFQLYPLLGEKMSLDKMFISSFEDVAQHTFWRNFIGITLIQCSSFFALILFLFYCYGYFLKKDKKDLKYLYFAFFCLSFFLSYLNMVFMHDAISQLWLWRISRFGLTVSNLLLIYLSMSFTGYLNKSWKLKAILSLPNLYFVFLVLSQNDIISLEKAFSVFVVVNMPYLFFALGIALWAAIKQRTVASTFYIIGFSIFFILIIRDSVVFSLKEIPYAWLIPDGYAIFIIFIFFILATEQVYIYRTSENRAVELEAMKDTLEDRVKRRTSEIEQQKEELAVQSDYLRAMNDNLTLIIHELNQKNEEITQQRDEIDYQKTEIEQKSKNITDSIHYAKRIQQAIFPNRELLETVFPRHFILFKPKQVVSGDFYFFKKHKNKIYLAVADCTGHGVPGAFMSMLGVAILNEILQLHHIETPADALNLLRSKLKTALHQTGRRGEQQDGMDIALCVIDEVNLKMDFSGANNHIYIYRKNKDLNTNELIVVKGDPMPIGIHPFDHKVFTNHSIDLKKDDNIYLFSDGFISQFGGHRGDKFKSKRLKEILHQVQTHEMDVQFLVIEKALKTWQGDHKQVDDILLLGVNLSS